MRGVAFVAVAAGAAACVHAQTTRVIFEATTTPGIASAWQSSITVDPGATVYVRIRVRLEGATALGLAGITTAPTLDHWRHALDTPVPFTFPGLNNSCPPLPQTETAYVGRHVSPDVPTNTGRMYPFGSAAAGRAILWNYEGDEVLRLGNGFADFPPITYWVNHAQLTPQLNGSCFNSSLDVVVFRYAVQLAATQDSPRAMTATASSISQNRGTWYLNAAGTQTLNVNAVVDSAVVLVTPGPGVWGVIGIAGVCVSRRKRGLQVLKAEVKTVHLASGQLFGGGSHA